MAQGNLSACLPITLKYEGGKVNNPADPGGRTNEGVTQRTYDGYRRGRGLATRDVYLLEDRERDDIYKNLYWTPAGCETLPAGLDLCHFDGTVNSGRGNSAKWLKISGTEATAGSIHAYSAARLASMHSFRAWATFGKGWAARVAGVEAKAIAMMVSPAAASVAVAKAARDSAVHARGASAAAHGATAAVVGGIAAAPTHPTFGILLALVAAVGAVWSAFHASTSGARAAVLAHAATAP